MNHPRTIALILYATCASTLSAQDAVTARTGELPAESPYVTLNLDAVANDPLAIPFPADRVQVGSIPFDLVKRNGTTHLFLKPIGWNAWNDEANEYPHYIANYDNRLANTNNPARALLRVPVTDYAAAWLLATADNDPGLTNLVTFRLGLIDGQARTVYHDFVATIPRAKESKPANVARVISTPAGKLFLIRVPFGKIVAQDLRVPPSKMADSNPQPTTFLDLDITKQFRIAINLPDPNRFQRRPLGPPSGVRIYGLTLEKSPIQVTVTGAEVGNVFHQPQTPTFHLDVQNVHTAAAKYSLRSIVRSDEGVVSTNSHPEFAIGVGGSIRQTIQIPVKERGHYEVEIQFLAGDQVVAWRETTMAMLAPDTRKHRDESPFGTWDFGGVHYTPDRADVVGPLYVKAGMGYGMAQWNYTKADREKYGLRDGQDFRISSADDLKHVQSRLTNEPTAIKSITTPTRFLIFHETAISGEHLTKTPDVFTGRPPYKFNEAEEKQFQAMWKEAEESFGLIRAAFPEAEMYLGNGVPHVIEEFVRHKFPREWMHAAGNESGSFMRPPESQPLDFVGNNSGLWMFRQILDHYGYKDVPVRQCVEIGYPGCNAGNLTERTQAAYLVRHMIHSLAWKFPVIRPMCITDMGNSYYDSNWGSTGLCRAWPDPSPKQVYVAFATMTQVLDGAKFNRIVPTKSTVVYAVEFERKDKSFVTVFWTPRGSRPMTVEAPGALKQLFTDMMGREKEVEFKDGKLQIEINREPLYLATPQQVASIVLGAPRHDGKPAGKTFVIASLGKLSEWKVENEPSIELETYNFMNPRRKGNFAYRELAEFEGEAKVLEVKPQLPCEGSPYLQMYSVLGRNKPVEIPGKPTEIGVLVNGNGGWGRLIFELEDASGQRWISIGAEQLGAPMRWMESWIGADAFKKLDPKKMAVSDWNSDDAWGRSYINHDGWRFVRFPLPGQYDGEGYHWPKNSQWRFSGDGVVKYPLKFKKLVLTMPENVLHLTEYAPPPRAEIYLKDLLVTYEPAETVFAGE
jgi:hypothetical protein